MLNRKNNAKQIHERFDNICKSIAESLNMEFVESTWQKELRGFVITAFIDKLEGITLNDCESFHRELLKKTDSFDYDFLEVSSLGADRPIKSHRDFERFAGSPVEIKLFKKSEEKKTFIGIIKDYTDEYVEIEIDGQLKRFDHKNIALIKPYIDVESEVEGIELDQDFENVD